MVEVEVLMLVEEAVEVVDMEVVVRVAELVEENEVELVEVVPTGGTQTKFCVLTLTAAKSAM